MVTPAAFLAEMEAAGVRFRIEGGWLVADAPAGVVTAERSAYVRSNKAALIALVAGKSFSASPSLSDRQEVIAAARRRLIDDGGNPLCADCGRLARRDGMHCCRACDGAPAG